METDKKLIFGLDLGTASIGWAVVLESDDPDVESEILDLGVRSIPYKDKEQTNFEKGKPNITNADRRQAHSMRLNLHRYKMRRETLRDTLIEHGIINENTVLTEQGAGSTHETIRLRAKAATERIGLDELARVLFNINKKRGYRSNRKARTEASSSDYVGAISDRSKELENSNKTIGRHKLETLERDPHHSFKKEIYYRKDYIDEFERIWETQSRFYPALTDDLKNKIRDNIIFYQRPLKSQKDKVAYCEFESHTEQRVVKGKTRTITVGSRACPKSSPVFGEFVLWQTVNNLSFTNSSNPALTLDEKRKLVDVLTYCDKMTSREIIKLLRPSEKGISLNFKEVKGNPTMKRLLDAMVQVVEVYGHDSESVSLMQGIEKVKLIRQIMASHGIDVDFLTFDATLAGVPFNKQPAYQLWHLLYSFDGDKSSKGNETLIKKIMANPNTGTCSYGFNREAASILAAVTFPLDYGSLSAKAMQKILANLKQGQIYSDACKKADYNHSAASRTAAQIAATEYARSIELLPKNSLRNPVVEKILNEMIRVVNALIERYSEQYGAPAEIRVELAREMKKSAKERKKYADSIAANENENKKLIAELRKAPFKIAHPSRNDRIRYKLYKELEKNGYRTLYSDTPISEEQLFSKNFEIEHIIPKSRLFDDSFANKTIETHYDNDKKGNKTAIEYVLEKDGESGVAAYTNRIKDLLKKGEISKRKADNLLRYGEDIPEDFIERDLRSTQYIAKKAMQILGTVSPVVLATTGSITDRLRQDWGLINLMQELNWEKYDRQGLTETYKNRDGQTVRRIVDWDKRNDNRHHAMDALTIAFTRQQFIQYLNTLNAESNQDRAKIISFRARFMYRDNNGNFLFKPPMDAKRFSAEARRHLENILVSFKAKNKVVTRNNTNNGEGGALKKQWTPRGQLHKDTLYGAIKQYVTSVKTIDATFDREMIALVASKEQREALQSRLEQFGNNPKLAFTGKNSPEKNPIKTKSGKTVPAEVKIVELKTIYTVRKPIEPKLNVKKVVDKKVKTILEERLARFGGDTNKAFSNLDKDPIYLNREKGITIKRVTVKESINVIPLHDKRDHHGKKILSETGAPIATDFVITGNNHHAAFYILPDGKVEERVVSFFEATTRAIAEPPMPVVDRHLNENEGWQLLMTLKQNEFVVFPEYEERIGADGKPELVKTFDPKEINLIDPANRALISPHLFRVQKLSSKNYVFRHHLETNVEEETELQGKTWIKITTPIYKMKDCVKVRVDHTGRIVHVGEEP